MKKFVLFLILGLIALQSMSFALIRDNNIEWRSTRVYIPVTQMSGFVAQNGADEGAPVLEELGSTGIVGMNCAAEGDQVSHFMPVPRDMDVSQPVYFRTHYSIEPGEACAGTDVVTWEVKYSLISEDGTIVNAAAGLDTAVVYDTYTATTAEAWTLSPWGKLNTSTSEAYALSLSVEMDAETGISDLTTTGIYLMGLELEYTPRRTAINGMAREAARD